ncbi:MAG: bifunctional folylpolyglutamate synthase/dihydrofolate synthase [Candidatus Magasanikbacteria bacterium]|nr:bifunctional folylpolyglutamate synthase/dihydrofolate synthase [Candidatus Magasanikbacteria bacterium]
MKYNEAYYYLLSLKNVPRHDYMTAARPGPAFLERLRYFLVLLGNPEKKIPHYIHITGTSGKGSVTIMLASILRAAGKRVGAMTSPSADGGLGRTEINGVVMTKPDFARLMEKMKKALDAYIKKSPYNLPSEFELLTALSFLYFTEKKVEWAVVEVGLGGRYDSTNVIPHKDVAIITNIGLDHTELIGPTRADIAYEKAGIVKKGAVVFTGEQRKNLLTIFEKECRKEHAWLTVVQGNTKVIKQGLSGITFNYKNNQYQLPILGTHQIKNAILTIEAAKHLGIPEKMIQRGLKNIVLPTRLEVMSKKPLTILDGAHNPDKMKATTNTVAALKQKRIIHLLIGFAANKNWRAMLRQLALLKPHTVACTRFTENIFRPTVSPAELARQVKKLLPKTIVVPFLDPKEAVAWSRKKQKTSDVLLVTGSMYLSGELRKLFSSTK